MCVPVHIQYARQEIYFKKVSSQDEKLYPWTKVRDGRNEGWLAAAAAAVGERVKDKEEGLVGDRVDSGAGDWVAQWHCLLR